MDNSVFDDGKLVVTNHEGDEFVFLKEIWDDHILEARHRLFYTSNFDKIIETIRNPDRILKGSHNSHNYEKRFFDLYKIDNAVLGAQYNYVCIDVRKKEVRTVFSNVKQKKGEILWQKEN